MIDILGRRRANNPVLVGPPGVGKTAIVGKGLAALLLWWAAARKVQHLTPITSSSRCRVGSLVAGTSLRGALSEKIAELQAEVKRWRGQEIIVFIDELHTLIGAGSSGDSAQDVSNEPEGCLGARRVPLHRRDHRKPSSKKIHRARSGHRAALHFWSRVKEPSVDEKPCCSCSRAALDRTPIITA